MLKKLTYDTVNTAVSDVPEVKKTKAELDEAYQAHENINQRINDLGRLCTPVFDTSSNHTTPPSRLQVAHAQATLPGLRLQLIEREIAVEETELNHQRAVTHATRTLEEARIEPRKVMIAELFELLCQAQQLAKDIEAFDTQTMVLGGKPPLAPVAELVSDQYRPSFVQFCEERLKNEDWL